MRLPDRFLWGAATAAHQVEGNNVNSDCWALEHAAPSLFVEPSGDAADQYHRFDQDVRIVADLGLGAYRFSVEWARVEPERGHVSQAVLDHYRRCVEACLTRGIAPVITLHHFTQPRWLARAGGFAAADFPQRFAEQAARVARALDGIALVCTINELNLPVLAAPYFNARASEEQRAAAERALGAPLSAFFLFAGDEAILGNGLAAHRAARDAIRAIRPGLPVGMTLAISEEDAEPGGEAHRDARRERFYAPFLDAAREDDFVGVQTYSRMMSRADGSVGLAGGAVATTMGWEDRPEAVGAVCEWIASRWRTPMVVTENGYVGDDDGRRARFIETAVAGVKQAMMRGADVRGYFYWSLLDNFEWMLGYRQRFGLVGVDRKDQSRTVKPSADIFRAMAERAGQVEA
ncbi:glycoside hydrolase family 1 protein [Sphingomonas gilva]|uniref:Glycoside hydrolase family 1 protein n=2 Tax=Sphingomonas gilva TaxID=2305907 RepID=A0A396RY67_9SPHN|nr:glycoside hydrolase family 1 protein [Sphingomonas gilva]